MKKNLFIYAFFIMVLAILVGITLKVRLETPKNLRQSTISQWNSKFIRQTGNCAYVASKSSRKKTTVLSEGQGYGMLIAVKGATSSQADQKKFDQLDRYYLANRDGKTNLMSWKQTLNSKDQRIRKYQNSATDGDLYIAYSLIEAAKKWPEKANFYQRQAQTLLADILKYDYNSKTQELMVGNWAAHSRYQTMLRTSDVLPAQFDAFYKLTGNQTWVTIKQAMLKSLVSLSKQHRTGLIPDFAWIKKKQTVAVKAGTVSSKYDGDYYYNACRLPYNLAQSKNRLSQRVLNKMMKFFMKQEYISGGYRLNGRRLNHYQSASFGAPIFFAANHNAKFSKLVQSEKYIFIQSLNANNYYQSALTILTTLGTFK